LSPLATVLVPTHDHGPLLAHAVGSALRQTVADIEIFIVGDGVDPATRAVALELSGSDRRVTFFDNEKGPRHGETLRHEALQQADGRIVCYLSDDDLWLADHVSSMLELLDTADFAHALPVGIRVDGTAYVWPGHLSVPESRDRVISYSNFIPLSCGAHTLDFYRRLPFGWRTTPDGITTDVYMWSQILSEPGCVTQSGGMPTVLHFPSSWRPEMTPEHRLDELARWHARILDGAFGARFASTVLEETNRERAVAHEKAQALGPRVTSLQEQLKAVQAQLQDRRAELATAQSRLGDLEGQLVKAGARIRAQEARLGEINERLEASQERLQRSKQQIERMSSSLTWRTRDFLLRVPGVAQVTRWAGAARARRAAD
jgi:hypothetical protein